MIDYLKLKEEYDKLNFYVCLSGSRYLMKNCREDIKLNKNIEDDIVELNTFTLYDVLMWTQAKPISKMKEFVIGKLKCLDRKIAVLTKEEHEDIKNALEYARANR